MGGIISKRLEHMMLNQSCAFGRAVEAAFEESRLTLQYRIRGLQPYQLLDAVQRVYKKIVLRAGPEGLPLEDPVFSFQRLWLKCPPNQYDLDVALSIVKPFENGVQILDLVGFRQLTAVLFREMALSHVRQQLMLYVPLGAATSVAAQSALRRLPALGDLFGAHRPLLPSALIGSVLGVALALQT